VLFLPKYSAVGASSRYRLYQYFDYFERHGIICQAEPLLGSWYLQAIYESGAIPLVAIVQAALHRLWHLLKVQNYNAVVFQYELFPYFPALLEVLIGRTYARLLADYDDAIYVNYQRFGHPLIKAVLRKKIPQVIANVQAVTAANPSLVSYARRYNSDTYLLPTVVDLTRYPTYKVYERRAKKPMIGWIGTPRTLQYLKTITEPLQRLAQCHSFILKVIGGGPLEIPGIKVISVPWSEATEVQELLELDIGVMPLPDLAVTRGKSGLKLIQYMACGLAVVASPVGVNSQIVVSEQNGLLAMTPDEWVTQLSRLIEDLDLCRALGQAARRTVEESYCLEVMAPRFLEIIRQVATEPR
jgi:glycosyltransferase involved in cell wall biosynthesis